MIHVFGDSYCDPCSGHLEQSKRWYNNLGEPTFIYGLAGSSIDWSLDNFINGHVERSGKIIFIESIPRRFHFEFLKTPRHDAAVMWGHDWENDKWLSEPGMEYVHKHKKFVKHFHNNYKDYHKATKARCVLKAFSDQYEKVLYFATSRNWNNYAARDLQANNKFKIADIKLMDVSRGEIIEVHDPEVVLAKSSFRDQRSNHFSEPNHEILSTYIKRMFNNESVEDIIFKKNLI
jgi:hypothetical protein